MPIISSKIREDAAQIDGRRYITEIHADHSGREHTVTYLAEPDADTQAALAVHAANVAASLVESEFQALVAHTFAGHSLLAFPFADLAPQDGARRLLRYMHNLTDPRPAKTYLEIFVAAGQTTVQQVLGLSDEAAAGVMAWAQGVLDGLAAEDAARAGAELALEEVR